MAGKSGVYFRTGYCASKFALIGFMDALRLELVDEGMQAVWTKVGHMTRAVLDAVCKVSGIMHHSWVYSR
jgi:NAD(P)-dependent dehydrogenase (short-subunit alcohol dehydrogenase family)